MSSIVPFRPKIDQGDFFQLKEHQLCWLVLAPISKMVHHSRDKDVAIKRLSEGQKALFYWWYLENSISTWGLKKFYEKGYAQYIPLIMEGMELIGNIGLLQWLKELKEHTKKEGDSWSIEDEILDEFFKKNLKRKKENVILFETYIRANPADFFVKKDDLKQSGEFKTYFPSGLLKNHFSMKDGLLHGNFKVYSSKGILLKDEDYEEGVLKYYTYYRKSGEKNLTVKPLGESETARISYWSNGKKWQEVHYNEQGEMHGKYIKWNNKGHLTSEKNFEHGKEVGFHQEYYQNGLRKIIYKVVNNTRKLMSFWDKEGTQTIKDGTGTRIDIYEHKEGEVKKTISAYKNGQNNGAYIYSINDKIQWEANYKDGQLHGERKTYDKNGELEKIEFYDNGRKTKTKAFKIKIGKNQKLILMKPPISTKEHETVIQTLAYPSVRYNGEVSKKEVTEYDAIGIFIGHYQQTTFIMTRDDQLYLTTRRTAFYPEEKALAIRYPNSELFFMNHFQSPYNESFHYIKNGQSIRVFESYSYDRQIGFSAGEALPEEKVEIASNYAYYPIAKQHQLIEKMVGISYPDIPNDMVFKQYVTALDEANVLTIKVEKGEQLLTDIFNKAYVHRKAFVAALRETVIPLFQAYNFTFDVKNLSFTRVKNGLSQRLSLISVDKNFSVIVSLNFKTQLKIKDAMAAENTPYGHALKKGNFVAANFYPAPPRQAFLAEVNLSMKETADLLAVFVKAYYLVYFEALA